MLVGQNNNQATDVNLSKSDVVAFGDNTGKISFKLVDGQKPFEYTWNQQKGELNGNGILNLLDREISIRDLPAGQYDLLIVDATGQVMFDHVVVISAPESEEIDNYLNTIEPPRSTPIQKEWPIAAETRSMPIARKKLVEKEISSNPAKEFGNEKLVAYKTIYFRSDSSALSEKASYELHKLMRGVKKSSVQKIIISGHTNGNPGIQDAYCQNLALDRAQEVQKYIQSHYQYKWNIESKSIGKADPIADNNTRMGRIRNQRVVIEIYGNK